MFKTSMRSAKKPRLLGELGDLSHAKVSASEFKYSQGTEIFGQGSAAEYTYQVAEGAVRTHKLLFDGRRQIERVSPPRRYLWPRAGDVHRFTAEAIINTTVQPMKRQRPPGVSSRSKTDPAGTVSKQPDQRRADNFEHVENHMLLLGRQTAPERVAAFLTEMNTCDSRGRHSSSDEPRRYCGLSRPRLGDRVT